MNGMIVAPFATAVAMYLLSVLKEVPWALVYTSLNNKTTGKQQRQVRALVALVGLVLTLCSAGTALVVLTRLKCSQSLSGFDDGGGGLGLGGAVPSPRATRRPRWPSPERWNR